MSADVVRKRTYCSIHKTKEYFVSLKNIGMNQLNIFDFTKAKTWASKYKALEAVFETFPFFIVKSFHNDVKLALLWN